MNSEKVISNIKKAIKEHFDSNYAYDMLVDFELDVIEWYSLFEYIDKLKQENKQLQEELKLTIGIVEHNRIISGKNKEIHQLKDNWNELRKWIVYNKHNENTEQHYLVVDYGTLLGKMQELEQESDSNVKD